MRVLRWTSSSLRHSCCFHCITPSYLASRMIGISLPFPGHGMRTRAGAGKNLPERYHSRGHGRYKPSHPYRLCPTTGHTCDRCFWQHSQKLSRHEFECCGEVMGRWEAGDEKVRKGPQDTLLHRILSLRIIKIIKRNAINEKHRGSLRNHVDTVIISFQIAFDDLKCCCFPRTWATYSCHDGREEQEG
jgi:hypothetical protein